MKKLFALLTVLALLLPVLAGCQSTDNTSTIAQTNAAAGSANASDENTPPAVPQPDAAPETTVPAGPSDNGNQEDRITPEQAKEIALQDAGLTADQVRDLDVELDRDNGTLHYDVDFEKDSKDYDYEIDAVTGAILKKNIPANPTSSTQTETQKQLTREEARDIALKHAGVTVSQVRDLETELDRDEGTLHYDVDFESSGNEYEYEIDAYTGQILKSRKERD